MPSVLQLLSFDRKYDFRYFAILAIFGVVAPFLFPEIISQLSLWWIFVIMAITWDLQGGQMGYNSFGNIIFFGIGMYICSITQISLFHDLGLWTEAGGENTFVINSREYFIGIAFGLLLSFIIPIVVAGVLGAAILRMRGQYFAICTLALGASIGEIAASIEILGAGSGLSVPIWPKDIGNFQLKGLFFYFLAFTLFVIVFFLFRFLLNTRFGLSLQAIRDDEDKAESTGMHTTRLKIISWMFSAGFLGLAGAIVGYLVGFIDPIDVAFSGATYGVWMVLMAIMGGKGTLWGPIIGATAFHLFQELFWTFLLGWQRVALGLLIIGIVLFFPEGFLGWIRKRVRETSTSHLAQ